MHHLIFVFEREAELENVASLCFHLPCSNVEWIQVDETDRESWSLKLSLFFFCSFSWIYSRSLNVIINKNVRSAGDWLASVQFNLDERFSLWVCGSQTGKWWHILGQKEIWMNINLESSVVVMHRLHWFERDWRNTAFSNHCCWRRCCGAKCRWSAGRFFLLKITSLMVALRKNTNLSLALEL